MYKVNRRKCISSPDEISFEQLPEKFILKLSNGSSTNLVVEDKGKPDPAKVRLQFRGFSGSSCGFVQHSRKDYFWRNDLFPMERLYVF